MTWHGHYADPSAPYDTSAEEPRCWVCGGTGALDPDPKYPDELICEDCREAVEREEAETDGGAA
jgi:hypothetical protein